MKGVGGIDLTQERDKWRAFVSTVIIIIIIIIIINCNWVVTRWQ
jgi:hypothetical protein